MDALADDNPPFGGRARVRIGGRPIV
jgi:hypothetical protein